MILNAGKIILITCGKFEKHTIEYVSADIERIFGFQVDLKECDLDVSQFYNPARRQYNADMIMQMHREYAPKGYEKYMSLFKGDLFIPILTYIFGQAQLGGKFGIASMFRLRNELYGLGEDRDLLLERFSKVIVHELGHTFGLKHCRNGECVMRSSTYVEDLDMKSLEFCRECESGMVVLPQRNAK